MSAETLAFESAEEAVSHFERSDSFNSADFAGGPLITHKLDAEGNWIEYGTGEPVNKTEMKTKKNDADLAEHLKIINDLRTKGFSVVIKDSKEINVGAEIAKADYEQKIHAMVYTLKGEEIEMRHFEGTRKEFEDEFADEAWLQELADDDDTLTPPLQNLISVSESSGDSNHVSNKTQAGKESGWANFWNNLLKPKTEQETTAEPVEINLLDLFTSPNTIPSVSPELAQESFLDIFTSNEISVSSPPHPNASEIELSDPSTQPAPLFDFSLLPGLTLKFATESSVISTNISSTEIPVQQEIVVEDFVDTNSNKIEPTFQTLHNSNVLEFKAPVSTQPSQQKESLVLQESIKVPLQPKIEASIMSLEPIVEAAEVYFKPAEPTQQEVKVAQESTIIESVEVTEHEEIIQHEALVDLPTIEEPQIRASQEAGQILIIEGAQIKESTNTQETVITNSIKVTEAPQIIEKVIVKDAPRVIQEIKSVNEPEKVITQERSEQKEAVKLNYSVLPAQTRVLQEKPKQIQQAEKVVQNLQIEIETLSKIVAAPKTTPRRNEQLRNIIQAPSNIIRERMETRSSEANRVVNKEPIVISQPKTESKPLSRAIPLSRPSIIKPVQEKRDSTSAILDSLAKLTTPSKISNKDSSPKIVNINQYQAENLSIRRMDAYSNINKTETNSISKKKSAQDTKRSQLFEFNNQQRSSQQILNDYNDEMAIDNNQIISFQTVA